MDTIKDFEFKRRKYMPVFPKARGKPTIYIPGYPYEDEEPMPASEYHGVQINTFYEQLARYFEIHTDIYVGYDNFIYYEEGKPDKSVAPDVYVVFGVQKKPPRRSFYTWAEGAVPTAVFEFLSDSTAHQDRNGKVGLYLIEIGVEEYFLHQPDPNRPPEFRGWRRNPSGGIVEIAQDGGGGLFSESLNLWLRWEERENNVRLLRPYLPDGTAITTSVEEKHLRLEAEAIAVEESERRREAETLARAEAQHRREAEAELERLRAQLANRQDEGA
jgi:Uma2 family endonuclease